MSSPNLVFQIMRLLVEGDFNSLLFKVKFWALCHPTWTSNTTEWMFPLWACFWGQYSLLIQYEILEKLVTLICYQNGILYVYICPQNCKTKSILSQKKVRDYQNDDSQIMFVVILSHLYFDTAILVKNWKRKVRFNTFQETNLVLWKYY